MSKSHDLAWCAGFFDGDGFVTITKAFVKPKNENQEVYEQYRLQVGINHVAPAPLYKIAKLLGGQVVLDKASMNHKYDKYNRKPRYYWRLGDDRAREALVQMLPYLVNKTNVAELGIEFRNTFVTKGGGTLPEGVLEIRKRFREELIRLNSLD